ncbi:MAG TPA: hypothetical protein VE732_05560, partial [Nitrososphaera sp.]|nr:hypothetical protein [Nitrososphaera sp.]
LCFMLAMTPACAQNGGKNYFPLADGAKWDYVGNFSTASGKQFSVHMTSRVEGETLINGKRYFKFVTMSDFSGVPEVGRQIEDVRYYRVGKDGIYVRPGSDTDKPELLEMPTPIPIDVKWLSGATEVRAEHVGNIKVNSHEYMDCLKVTYKMADGVKVTENYLAPGVGIVKVLYVNTTKPQSTGELMLERYTFDMPKAR